MLRFGICRLATSGILPVYFSVLQIALSKDSMLLRNSALSASSLSNIQLFESPIIAARSRQHLLSLLLPAFVRRSCPFRDLTVWDLPVCPYVCVDTVLPQPLIPTTNYPVATFGMPTREGWPPLLWINLFFPFFPVCYCLSTSRLLISQTMFCIGAKGNKHRRATYLSRYILFLLVIVYPRCCRRRPVHDLVVSGSFCLSFIRLLAPLYKSLISTIEKIKPTE